MLLVAFVGSPTPPTPPLIQSSHDNEQGGDHANEDQRNEPDPHPLLWRQVYPAHFGSRSPFFSFAFCDLFLAARTNQFIPQAEQFVWLL